MRGGFAISALPLERIGRHPDLCLALFVAGIVAVLLVPLPAPALDLLLALNVTCSALILAAVLLTDRLLGISTFPSLLLLSTLFRLSLNVSTTRAILSHGTAGAVVQAFGRSVIGGDLVVGLVLFAILTLVQFLVIAKGAERVAEVGARFSLDAMPGNQMSIDAALRAGSLSDLEAREKRDELARESQFYGAMDGAMKFVKGDAVAGMLITAINLLAGMAIGMLRFGETFGASLSTYSILSIGDGLVSQLPALLITLAAGILTTRVSSREKPYSLGRSLQGELLAKPKPLAVAGGFAIALALVPGLPGGPFGFLGVGLSWMAFAIHRRAVRDASAPEGRQRVRQRELSALARRAEAQRATTDALVPTVVPVQLDLGGGLSEALGWGDGVAEETILVRELIPQLRDALYLESGVRFPGIRVRGGLPELGARCVIRIRDVPVATEFVDPLRSLAVADPERLRRLGIEAEPTIHPLTGARAALVPETSAASLEAAGIRVWSPAGVITLHLIRVLRRQARSFIQLHETAELVQRLERAYPTLVKEVVPKLLSLSQVSDILRRLVDERVSIRDLKSIFEALAEQGPHQSDLVLLTEYVRAALSLQLAHAHTGGESRLPVVLLDPLIEDTVRAAITCTPGGSYLALDLEIRGEILARLSRVLNPIAAQGVRPIILTSAEIRRYVRKLIEDDHPEAVVLSFQELPSQLTIQPIARIELADDLS